MARYKTQQHTSTVNAAVADALSELQGLRDEVREIVDNASGTGLENTQRIQTLGDTADTLDNYVDDEPDAPEFLAELPITYTSSTGRRSTSRAMRHDNAIQALQAAIAEVESWLEDVEGNTEGKTEDEREGMRGEAEQFLEAVKDVADNLDGTVEYPGMFG